jgi:hypothetical protein
MHQVAEAVITVWDTQVGDAGVQELAKAIQHLPLSQTPSSICLSRICASIWIAGNTEILA